MCKEALVSCLEPESTFTPTVQGALSLTLMMAILAVKCSLKPLDSHLTTKLSGFAATGLKTKAPKAWIY